jgi:hypothetical protein
MHVRISPVFIRCQRAIQIPHILEALVDFVGGEHESVPLYWHKGGVITLSVALGRRCLNILRGRNTDHCCEDVCRYWVEM